MTWFEFHGMLAFYRNFPYHALVKVTCNTRSLSGQIKSRCETPRDGSSSHFAQYTFFFKTALSPLKNRSIAQSKRYSYSWEFSISCSCKTFEHFRLLRRAMATRKRKMCDGFFCEMGVHCKAFRPRIINGGSEGENLMGLHVFIIFVFAVAFIYLSIYFGNSLSDFDKEERKIASNCHDHHSQLDHLLPFPPPLTTPSLPSHNRTRLIANINRSTLTGSKWIARRSCNCPMRSLNETD